MTADNPLLQVWTAPFGLPPFAHIRAEHFAPALHEAMRQHRSELAEIGAQTEPPTFANTLAAYDRSGRQLARVASVFYNLAGSATSEALQAVQREMAAPMAAHHSAVVMDAALFARIDTLHSQRHTLGLDAEALRLMERVHLDFVRAGARLEPASQQRYAVVMQALAALTTQFAQNVLHDESSFVLELNAEADLAGLPDFMRAATRQAALDRSRSGHVVTLSRSLVVPFLTFSERRDLREQAWRAWTTRGEHAGEHDNREIARRILALRNEQARLHGHTSFADYALADTMAGQRGAVQGLLDEVWPRALRAVQLEREALQGAMLAAGNTMSSIEPWDWRYWAERVRLARYAVDDAEVKPYFQLERVVEVVRLRCAFVRPALQSARRPARVPQRRQSL